MYIYLNGEGYYKEMNMFVSFILRFVDNLLTDKRIITIIVFFSVFHQFDLLYVCMFLLLDEQYLPDNLTFRGYQMDNNAILCND